MYARTAEKANAINNMYVHFINERRTSNDEEIAIIDKILNSLREAVQHCADLGSLQLEKELEKEE